MPPKEPSLGYDLWADWMQQNGFHPQPVGGHLPLHLPAHCVTMHHCDAQPNLPTASLVWADPNIYIYVPASGNSSLRVSTFRSLSTTMKTMKTQTKKKNKLSKLALSGHHVEQSAWVLTQKYNSVLKNVREQTCRAALFHCKDCESIEDCCDSNK